MRSWPSLIVRHSFLFAFSPRRLNHPEFGFAPNFQLRICHACQNRIDSRVVYRINRIMREWQICLWIAQQSFLTWNVALFGPTRAAVRVQVAAVRFVHAYTLVECTFRRVDRRSIIENNVPPSPPLLGPSFTCAPPHYFKFFRAPRLTAVVGRLERMGCRKPETHH